MAADPVAAGRKGGSSRSEAKIAAARRNGFQRASSAAQPSADATQGTVRSNAVLVVQQKRDEL